MASFRDMASSGRSLKSSLGSGMSLRNGTQRRQPSIKIKEVKMKPHLSGVEREERREQRLKDAKADKIIAKAFTKETEERAAKSGVVDYREVGKEYENLWNAYKAGFITDSGRVMVNVRNSLQFELRKVEEQIDKITRKYAKKRAGNQDIAKQMRKLQAKLENEIEVALRELLTYTLEQEHMYTQELAGRVRGDIRDAEEAIGYTLNDDQYLTLAKNAIMMIIQRKPTPYSVQRYIYNQVDRYSRILS